MSEHEVRAELDPERLDKRLSAVDAVADFLRNCPPDLTISVSVHKYPLSRVPGDWRLKIIDAEKPESFLTASKDFGEFVNITLLSVK